MSADQTAAMPKPVPRKLITKYVIECTVFDLLLVIRKMEHAIGYWINDDGSCEHGLEIRGMPSPWKVNDGYVAIRFGCKIPFYPHLYAALNLLVMESREGATTSAMKRTSVRLLREDAHRLFETFSLCGGSTTKQLVERSLLTPVEKKRVAVDDWFDTELKMSFKTYTHYSWTRDQWDLFVALLEERKQAKWEAVAVWPAARAFCLVLARCADMDVHTAAALAHERIVLPRRAEYEAAETKRRLKRGERYKYHM